MFKENQFSVIGQLAVYLLIALALCSALLNLYRGIVPSPVYFIITFSGLILFLIAKFSVIKKGIFVSFGTKEMSVRMANVYRLGYWLMLAGVLFTFLE